MCLPFRFFLFVLLLRVLFHSFLVSFHADNQFLFKIIGFLFDKKTATDLFNFIDKAMFNIMHISQKNDWIYIMHIYNKISLIIRYFC